MDAKSSDDNQLVEALKTKSLDALEELYDRYHRTALAVAYKVLGDRNLAEDVVQEAFLAVWRQADGFDKTKGTARGWLFSIVRHRAIDVTRGKAFSRERIPLDTVISESKYPDTWKLVSEGFDRKRIRDAVNELPNEQREAIDLAYFGGYTQREIAEKTGLPLGTVKGRMRLGMQKLRGILSEAGLSE